MLKSAQYAVVKALRLGLVAIVAGALLMTSPGRARDDSVGAIVRIEQDWELVVSMPDANRCSPQLYVQMFPESGQDYCCQLLINYNDQPSFSAGGIQIQIWNGESVLDGQDNAPKQAVLQIENETVTFTLAMEIDEGMLQFSAKDVSCTSWGDVTRLRTTTKYEQTSFSNYLTSDTVSNSGILLGSNRVTSWRIKEVRKFDRFGNKVTEDGQKLYP